MAVRIDAPKDVYAGLIFIAGGVATFLLSQQYEIGTAVAMGPGYFPALMGLVLAGIGVGALVRGFTRTTPDPLTPHRIEPLLLVFAGVLAFALLIERAGLFVAAAVLIGIVCIRRLLARPLEVLVLYVALSGFSALVFVQWFGLQLPLFWGR